MKLSYISRIICVGMFSLTACKLKATNATTKSDIDIKNPLYTADNQVCVTDEAPNIDKVYIKTKTQSTSQKFYFVLHCGRIWYKANTDMAFKELNGRPKDWTLFNKSGLPERDVGLFSIKSSFGPVTSIREITSDGNNLVAISNSGQIYYTKVDPLVEKVEWDDKWGLPGHVTIVPNNISVLAMSHRGLWEAGGYFGYYGNYVPNGAGVTTLYALIDRNGKRDIIYGDPWLKSGFTHTVSVPLKGRFIPEHISTSGSTIFLIDKTGRMFTRLADFDTVGSNPVQPYTWEHSVTTDDLLNRDLPAEPWLAQPMINLQGKAKISKLITLVQTCDGKETCIGNQGRELRVPGLNENGNKGYYYKKIFPEECKVPFQIEACIQRAKEKTYVGMPQAKLAELGLDWNFYPTYSDTVNIKPEDYLDSTLNVGMFQKTQEGKIPLEQTINDYTASPRNKDYTGTVQYCPEALTCEKLPVKMYGFNVYTDVARVVFTINGQNVEGQLYHHERMRGIGDNLTMRYHATILFPKSVFSIQDPKIRNFLNRAFQAKLPPEPKDSNRMELSTQESWVKEESNGNIRANFGFDIRMMKSISMEFSGETAVVSQE